MSTDSSNIGVINPYRYRSYRYDSETGLYYLQSRYYNPEWGRFLNADGLVSTGQGLSHNMYIYCSNNPINRFDPTGEIGILTCIIICAVVGAIIGGTAGAIISKKQTGKVQPKAVAVGAIVGGIAGGAVGAGGGTIASRSSKGWSYNYSYKSCKNWNCCGTSYTKGY